MVYFIAVIKPACVIESYLQNIAFLLNFNHFWL